MSHGEKEKDKEENPVMDSPSSPLFEIPHRRICAARMHPALALRSIPAVVEFYAVDGARDVCLVAGLSKKNGRECYAGIFRRNSRPEGSLGLGLARLVELCSRDVRYLRCHPYVERTNPFDNRTGRRRAHQTRPRKRQRRT